MNLRTCHMRSEQGFTLIEIIVALILTAIMATALAQAMGRSLEQSATPVRLVKEQYELIDAMETLTGRYRDEIKNGTLNLTVFNAAYVNDTYLNCATTGVCVDAANTGFQTLTTQSGSYTTQSDILLVTLKQESAGGMIQRIHSIFTQ